MYVLYVDGIPLTPPMTMREHARKIRGLKQLVMHTVRKNGGDEDDCKLELRRAGDGIVVLRDENWDYFVELVVLESSQHQR